MKHFLIGLAVVSTIAVSAASTIAPSPANAAPQHAAHQTSATERFSDSEVVEFLATGRGPMADAHPSLTRFIPPTDIALTREEVDELTDEYTSADARFHEDVTQRLQSGDPYVTLQGLASLRAASEAVAKVSGAPANVGEGKCATVLAVALAFWIVLAIAVVRELPEEGITNEAFAAELATAFSK